MITTPLLLLPAMSMVTEAPDTSRLAYPPVFQAVSRHANTDSLQAEVVRQVKARFGQHYGCSALAFCALCATLGTSFSEPQLRSLSEGFAGGIGHKFADGTCGSLAGAVQALSMYASGNRDKHFKLAAEVYDALQRQEGGIKCSDIYGKHGFDHCDACVFCTVKKVVEVLQREGDVNTATIQFSEAVRGVGTSLLK